MTILSFENGTNIPFTLKYMLSEEYTSFVLISINENLKFPSSSDTNEICL